MTYSFLRLLRLIETNGIVDYHKHRIYGTAAVLHFLNCLRLPISNLDQTAIDLGEKYLAHRYNLKA